MERNKDYAVRLLRFYLRRAFDASIDGWDGDNDAEVAMLVDLLWLEDPAPAIAQLVTDLETLGNAVTAHAEVTATLAASHVTSEGEQITAYEKIGTALQQTAEVLQALVTRVGLLELDRQARDG